MELTPDDNDTYLITCPELPELTTYSECLKDVEHHASGALREAVAARQVPDLTKTSESGLNASMRRVFMEDALAKMRIDGSTWHRATYEDDCVILEGWYNKPPCPITPFL